MKNSESQEIYLKDLKAVNTRVATLENYSEEPLLKRILAIEGQNLPT